MDFHTLNNFIDIKPEPFELEANQNDPLLVCEVSIKQNEPRNHYTSEYNEYMDRNTKRLKDSIERKFKDAQRKRLSRENQTEEERLRRKERAAYLARIRRKNLTPEEKKKTQQADRQRAKLKRASESQEERQNRLLRDAERKRQRRQQLAQFKKLLDDLENSRETE